MRATLKLARAVHELAPASTTMTTNIGHVMDRLNMIFAGNTCDLSLRDLAMVARCHSSLVSISRTLRGLILKTRDGIERVITFANCNVLMDIMPDAFKTADYHCELLTLMVAQFNRTHDTRLERFWYHLGRMCDNVHLHTPGGHDDDARVLAHAQFGAFKSALRSVFDHTYHHERSVLRIDCLHSIRVWLHGPDILIPGAYYTFPIRLKKCKHFVMQTVLGFAWDPSPTSQAAKFIRHIHFSLRADSVFVLQLLRAGVYVPLVEKLRGDREFITQAVLLNHHVVFEMSQALVTDLDLAILATEQHWESVRVFDASVVRNTKVLVAAVSSFAKSKTTTIQCKSNVATACDKAKPIKIQEKSVSDAMTCMHSYIAEDDEFLSLLALSLTSQDVLQKALGWLSTSDCITSEKSALQIVRWNWRYLSYVSMNLRGNENFMMQCIAINEHTAKLGAEVLQQKKSYWQRAAGIKFEVVALYIKKQASLKHLHDDADILAAAHSNRQKRRDLAIQKANATKQAKKKNKT